MARTVTLVNDQGEPMGSAELIDAHTGQGQLHLAFSVYVFRNKHREILIQQRSRKKMLWPLIWANTCCSHPFENETPVVAGQRRLKEELGVDCPLSEHSSFVYRAEDPGRGVEHEFVKILIGNAPDSLAVRPNPDEVAAYKWIDVDELRGDMQANPQTYAPWFHVGLEQILSKIDN